MEPLFRFTLVRPAVSQDPDNPSIALAQDSPFQKALIEAAEGEQDRQTLSQIASDFVAEEGFIGDPHAHPMSEQLQVFTAALDQMVSNKAISRSKIVSAVRDAFGIGPDTLVKK